MMPRLLLALTPLLLAGCTSFELTRVRNDLARQLPEAGIGEGYAVSFGGLSVGFARWLSGFADEEDGELAQLALREVRRVSFGRYDVEGAVDARRLVMPARLRHYVEDEGWVHLATFREAGEAGWVLYRERGDAITDLFAVVLTEEDLVLARVSGDLSALVLNVLAHERTRLPFFEEPETEEAEAASSAVVEAAQAVAG
jgi:hypothetical protein